MTEEPSEITEETGNATPSSSADSVGASTEFREGRYLFCVVRPNGEEAAASFSAQGLEGREASLLGAGDLGAVVQPCESLFDASDPSTVRQWLLRHHAVVDAAGEAFGTPLPFRFDTVVVGDDDRVREWLDDNAGRIHAVLADLAGRWEYRIEVTIEDEALSASLEAEDDRLGALHEEIEATDGGRAFLLQKKYDERLRSLRHSRREARAEDLLEHIEPLAERVERSSRTSTGVFGEVDGGAVDSSTTTADRSSPAISIAILATPVSADAIGERLDAIAAEPGIEVRYSGPWPPYTFAPDIDDQDR